MEEFKEVLPLYNDLHFVIHSIFFHIHLVLDNPVMSGFFSLYTRPNRGVHFSSSPLIENQILEQDNELGTSSTDNSDEFPW